MEFISFCAGFWSIRAKVILILKWKIRKRSYTFMYSRIKNKNLNLNSKASCSIKERLKYILCTHFDTHMVALITSKRYNWFK